MAKIPYESAPEPGESEPSQSELTTIFTQFAGALLGHHVSFQELRGVVTPADAGEPYEFQRPLPGELITVLIPEDEQYQSAAAYYLMPFQVSDDAGTPVESTVGIEVMTTLGPAGDIDCVRRFEVNKSDDTYYTLATAEYSRRGKRFDVEATSRSLADMTSSELEQILANRMASNRPLTAVERAILQTVGFYITLRRPD